MAFHSHLGRPPALPALGTHKHLLSLGPAQERVSLVTAGSRFPFSQCRKEGVWEEEQRHQKEQGGEEKRRMGRFLNARHQTGIPHGIPHVLGHHIPTAVMRVPLRLGSSRFSPPLPTFHLPQHARLY